MGTHPIFESDFDCLTEKMNSNITRLATRNIASFSVIGSGLMGAGIAQVGAQTGHQVVLYDISDAALDKAQVSIEKSVARVAKKKENGEQFMAETLGRITLSSDMGVCGANAELIVEAVVENLELKQKLFADLEAATTDTCILATNTSSLPVSAIGANLKNKALFGGLHFFNPVPMMKLLEVVKGNDTSDATFDAMMTWGQAMGKTTVSCIDTPGFIVNRLLVPYMMEAIRLVERGHASKEDVDIAMKLGAGYPMGPFELADYVGMDTTKFIMDGWHERMPEDPLFNPSELINEKVAEGKFGRKTGEGFYNYKK